MNNVTKRVYFAGLAMQALIAKLPVQDQKGQFGNKLNQKEMNEFVDELTVSAWSYADSMVRMGSEHGIEMRD